MSEEIFPGPTLRPLKVQFGEQTIAGFESAGTGRDILLVHGNSSSSQIWQKQLQGPLGAKYRLVAIDLPGHGSSSPAPDPEHGYSGAGYAGCIAAAAKELGLKNAVVVGWSLGGHAVLNAAPSLPMAAGLMIFGTPPIAKTPDGFSGFKGLSATTFTPAPSDAEIAAWLKTVFAPDYAPLPAFVDTDFRRTDGNARGYLGASVQAGRFVDEVEIVRGLRIPLAIVHGSEEQMVDLGYLQRLPAPTLWRGQVQVVHGAGHATQWERAEVFDRLVDAFASSL
ncbi:MULTISPECIES: alpha/beta fold hydrolase [unclassified Bradyrhizobium]|uniref:alpha/beta fold hydrolase n=1 Tax=unclassified Bradyrhizobium TaxID=2631580 RepID=UPI001BABCF03|nr:MULTISPECIES: alpha/beta hydrolase [unclassified Bradyrhizobium]MBR1208711.1 alpha/beta hydrolase [Bradyrhizobium sp. AUGA SZCCT0124]MBR1315269.1 alpha/beta hydrolase [Bradyrhizobium sp. AUGA SZCCT0051]MBR1344240.1 alpha/beta hydrolase [Bradyrhizobium sp. AUGA SZCCT0105]MBR1357773.1 alpha/beta hydrolase [Bradyrhizobium sp. AUGA SZCCT0045]